MSETKTNTTPGFNKVLLGLPHIDNKIHGKFVESLTALLSYSKTKGIDIQTVHTYRSNITFARNKIASMALKETDTKYLFFLDDDMVFEPDTLERLIEVEQHERAHGWRAGVVGALTFVRSEPHFPSMWLLATDKRTYNPIDQWSERLVSCDSIGMAATLISTDVLLDLAKGAQYYNNIFALFDNFDNLGEDFRFCRKARDASWDIICDTHTIVGHITETVIRYGDFKAYQMASKKEAQKFIAEQQYAKNKKKEKNKAEVADE